MRRSPVRVREVAQKEPSGSFFLCRLLQEAMTEELDIVEGEEELLMQILDHSSELVIDQVECADKVRCRYAHKRQNNCLFCFSSASSFHLCIEESHQFAISRIGQIKIRYDRFTFNA